MSIRRVMQTDDAANHNFATTISAEKTSAENLRMSAKKLSSEHDHDLALYFKPRSASSFCNHAVAVVAATAAIVAAVSSVIAASTRGRGLDSAHSIKLEDEPMTKLSAQELMNLRSKNL